MSNYSFKKGFLKDPKQEKKKKTQSEKESEREFCACLVIELRTPAASQRENGFARRRRRDSVRVDTFATVSFSYKGVRRFPLACQHNSLENEKDILKE